MISSPLKSHTNAYTVCGRRTLNVSKRFMKGSLRRLYETSIYEQTFLSEPIKNLKKNALSIELFNFNYIQKHLHKRYRVFRRDRELSRIPKRSLRRLRNQVKFAPGIYNAWLLVPCQSCKTINNSIKTTEISSDVKILTLTAEYARKEAQVHADMSFQFQFQFIHTYSRKY